MILVMHVIVQSASFWSPTGTWPDLDADLLQLFGSIAGALLLSALMFTLPISGFMLLADIGIAFIAKGAPTLNAMTFGMPVKSGIMLIMLFFYVSIGFPIIMENFEGSTNLLLKIFSDVR